MNRWEEDLLDAEAKRNKIRKDYVVCVENEDGGLYPIAVFSDPELAAGYINKQTEIAKALPWLRDVAKFRLLDFVVDSNVKEAQ